MEREGKRKDDSALHDRGSGEHVLNYRQNLQSESFAMRALFIFQENLFDPDGFAVWGFEELLRHRVPLYEAIARRYGYVIHMEDIPNITGEQDFLALLERTIDKGQP